MIIAYKKFQFQAFSQYRSKLLKKGEDEVETLRANTKIGEVKECIEKCRYITVKYSHVNTVGFSRGILISCCFIPDCLLIKLEAGVLVLGRVEIQRNKGIEIWIHKYFLLSD